ncbi:MAG: hypothetical protein EOO72_00730, partial [Myxococcaceae bacterium]
MSVRPVVRFASALLLLTACGSSDEAALCPAAAINGISLTITDAATGEPLCDASVEIRDGEYVDKQQGVGGKGPCGYGGATERPGTYTVTATQEG